MGNQPYTALGRHLDTTAASSSGGRRLWGTMSISATDSSGMGPVTPGLLVADATAAHGGNRTAKVGSVAKRAFASGSTTARVRACRKEGGEGGYASGAQHGRRRAALLVP